MYPALSNPISVVSVVEIGITTFEVIGLTVLAPVPYSNPLYLYRPKINGVEMVTT